MIDCQYVEASIFTKLIQAVDKLKIRSHSEICKLEVEKTAWMENHIRAAIPEWPEGRINRFEFNGLYECWSRSYHLKSRQLIRDYENLAAKLEIPDGYELSIYYGRIDIRKLERCSRNEYHQLIENIPMNSPVEPEAIWRRNWQNDEVGLCDCSFQNIKKSHVFESFHRAPMLRQEIFLNKWLGPQGYTMRMFFKGKGNGTRYLLGITHSTESPEPFIQAVTDDGYKPMSEKQKVSGKTKNQPKAQAEAPSDIYELSARERELMAELASIREQKAKA